MTLIGVALAGLIGCGHGEEAKEPEPFDFGAAAPAADVAVEAPTAPTAAIPGAEPAAVAATPAPGAPVPAASAPSVSPSPTKAAPGAPVTPAPASAPVAATTPAAGAPATTAPAPAAEVAPAAAEAPRSHTYPLDTRTSSLQVLVKFDRGSPMPSLGHDHIVAATGWSGKVRWGVPGDCSVEIKVPTAKLVVDPPGARKRFGLEGETPDSDKEKIRDNFQGRRQLDVATYPEITFKSTSCPGTSGQVEVPGQFTMLGKTRPVSLSMKVAADGATFRASGKLVINGSEWGLDPFTAPAGVLRNEDRLSFYIDAQGSAVD